uniref:Uncharacterized protein n=1 Tax=Medicago truncatula TaxID=3880 RepID=A2Q3L9_MEDTR|nr:hypothetical protein MtrDRAFT_AC155885g19v2 [Medicago truncatula]
MDNETHERFLCNLVLSPNEETRDKGKHSCDLLKSVDLQGVFYDELVKLLSSLDKATRRLPHNETPATVLPHMSAFQDAITMLMRSDNTLDMRIATLFAAINLLHFMFEKGHISDSSDLEYDDGISEDDDL